MGNLKGCLQKMARILITIINIPKKGRPYTDWVCARTWHMLLSCKDMAHVVGMQGHGTCCWCARAWHMLGCKDMTHVVGVKGHGTCWGERTRYMFLGWKDMARLVDVQGHGTYWGARTWHMLGCKDMAHAGWKNMTHVGCKDMVHVGVQKTWHMLGCKGMAHVGVQGHGTCWGARAWHKLGSRLCRTFKETVRMCLTSLRGQ